MVPPGIIDPQHSEIDQGNKPRLLRIYISYRLLLSVLFLALTHFQLASDYLGTSNQQLFSLTIVLYSIISVGTAVIFYRQRWRPSETALFAMLLIDTIAITSMMHASDSSDGSLGYLLMVTVAAFACQIREKTTAIAHASKDPSLPLHRLMAWSRRKQKLPLWAKERQLSEISQNHCWL